MKRNSRAGVEDLWTKTARDEHGNTRAVPSARHGIGLRWQARIVHDRGLERTKAFTRKTDAQDWLDEITAAQVTGSYIDPKLGRITFAGFYREWSARQVWLSGAQHAMDLAANSMTFENVELAELRSSHVETWVRTMQDKGLEPTTIRTQFRNARDVMRAAVRDRVIARDPSDQILLPRVREAAAAMTAPTAE